MSPPGPVLAAVRSGARKSAARVAAGLLLAYLMAGWLAAPGPMASGVPTPDSPPVQTLPLTSGEIEWLRAHPVIRVGGPAAFPPFFFYDDGDPMGMALDYARQAAARLRLRLEIVPRQPWSETLKAVQNHDIDLIACAARDVSRDAYLSYGQPYMSFPLVIVTRKDAPFVGGLSDLERRSVAIVKGEASGEWVKRDVPGAEIVNVSTLPESLEAVAFGKADAAIHNLATVTYWIERLGLANLRIAAPTLYNNYALHFAVRKDWPELVSLLDKALQSMSREEHVAIRDKWLSMPYERGFSWKTVLTWGIPSFLGFLLVLGWTIHWNRRLRREIAERREADARYTGVVENTRNGVAVYRAVEDGADFVFVDANRAVEEIERIGRDRLIGQRLTEAFPGVREFGLLDVLQRVWRTGNPESLPISRYRDERIAGWRNHYVYRLPGGDVVAVYSDETERKLAEERLRESEARYRALSDATFEAVLFSEKGVIREANRAAAEMFRRRRDHLIGAPMIDLVAPEDRETMALRLSETHSAPYELMGIRGDGTLFHAELRGSIITLGTHALRVSGIRDIDDRRKAEILLEKFFSLSQDLLCVASLEGRFLFINPAFHRILGHPREVLLHRPFLEFVHPDDAASTLDTLARLKNGASVTQFRNRYRAADGEYRWLEWSATPDAAAGVTFAVARDITGEKQAEAEKIRLEFQLHQARKMEAIGTLAGGIAHDFNNILGIILGNTELALEVAPQGAPPRRYLDEIFTASLRARDVIRQLLSYARQSETERKPIRLEPLFSESIRLMRPIVPSHIDIRTDMSGSGREDTVDADPSQIQRILMNLCTNAVHAMREKGGVLLIRLDTAVIGGDDVSSKGLSLPPDLPAGRYARLTVSDTGPGIPPIIIDRIFDPYFTTKEVGSGSGMGLSIALGIAKSHNGTITVASEPGKGARFHLYLPLSRQAPKPEPLPDAAPAKGSEHLLALDDEPAIAATLREMLDHLGYRVTLAHQPEEALARFRSTPDDFALVITDMSMPRMSGLDVARELGAIRPDTPVIICTGYSRMEIEPGSAKGPNIAAVLVKPVSMARLAETLRAVLDRPRPGPGAAAPVTENPGPPSSFPSP